MVELNENQNNDSSRFIREPAKMLPLSYIKEAEYLKQEGWNPNYIEVNNEKVFRVNVIGIVVSKDQISPENYVLSIDDGFSTMPLRTFDKPEIFLNVSIGDFVIIIGKPREFGGQRYILTEILRKIENNAWLNFRQSLFEKKGLNKPLFNKQEDEKAPVGNIDNKKSENIKVAHRENKNEEVVQVKEEEPKLIVTEEVICEENIEEQKVSDSKSPAEIIYYLIKELDLGEGVDIDVIIKRSNIADAEKIIDRFIKEGEIYQSKPGKIKIL
jgi:RPA family protein